MTRRSEQFRRLAESTDAAVRFRRLAVEPAVVDRLLNERIDRVAELMGVTPRTALRYAPDDLPASVADAIAEVLAN